MENIFITYNPSSEAESNTALRLQTISNLYGISVLLPYRHKNETEINSETHNRIERSQFIVAFCLNKLTKHLKQELETSIQLKKPIIIIYDKYGNNKINFGKYMNVKEVFVDFNDIDSASHTIASFLKEKLKIAKSTKVTKKEKSNNGLGLALIGVGLGLLALWALSKDTK